MKGNLVINILLLNEAITLSQSSVFLFSGVPESKKQQVYCP